MNGPEHREQGGGHVDPRLWLVVAFVLGALLTGGVALAAQGGDDSSSPRTSNRAARVPADPHPTRTVTASPSPAHRVGTMQMTKPLTDLATGDRVVYNMQLCHFERHVGGDSDVSLISCAGTPSRFQVPTLSLVPVEPGD